MPLQRGVPWLSIVPIAESRSSYNGLLVFLFIAISAIARPLLPSTASPRTALRRGPAWDCGYPDPSPRTQYTASSFAQPIRRVFGTLVFRARERVEMPPPGDMRPAAARRSNLEDLIWDVLYAPIAGGVGLRREAASTALQFLTIRRYLSLVFVALVGLLLVLAIWP